jgi:hypothetical protein
VATKSRELSIDSEARLECTESFDGERETFIERSILTACEPRYSIESRGAARDHQRHHISTEHRTAFLLRFQVNAYDARQFAGA